MKYQAFCKDCELDKESYQPFQYDRKVFAERPSAIVIDEQVYQENICRGGKVSDVLNEMFQGRVVKRTAVGGFSKSIDICRRFASHRGRGHYAPSLDIKSEEQHRDEVRKVILDASSVMTMPWGKLDKANPHLGHSEEVCYEEEYLFNKPNVASALRTLEHPRMEEGQEFDEKTKREIASGAKTYKHECEIVFPDSRRNDVIVTPGRRRTEDWYDDVPDLNLYLGAPEIIALHKMQLSREYNDAKHEYMGDGNPFSGAERLQKMKDAGNKMYAENARLDRKYHESIERNGNIQDLDIKSVAEDAAPLVAAVQDTLPRNTPVSTVNIYLCGDDYALGQFSRCYLYSSIRRGELRGAERVDVTHPEGEEE